MTHEALNDLEARADTSETAQQILIGWQNFQQGVRVLNTMDKDTHDDYILEMFSLAIQQCGHFLELSNDPKYFLGRVIDDVITKQTKVNPVDLSVCGVFMKLPLSKLPIARENPYIAVRIALELNKLGDQQKALEIINWAIAKNPHSLDLRFWKARINDSIDSYIKFIQIAPSDHYWVPRGQFIVINFLTFLIFFWSGLAFYCIADILIKQDQIDKALETYNTGVIAEKRQLQLFNNVELEEKRAVAFFLHSEKKIDRCPVTNK